LRSAGARAVGAVAVTSYGLLDLREKFHLVTEAQALSKATD
jgi:hypothetical protein